jgi:hypothetical protein
VCRNAAYKIEADSPVFCGAAAKNAPKFLKKSFLMVRYGAIMGFTCRAIGCIV